MPVSEDPELPNRLATLPAAPALAVMSELAPASVLPVPVRTTGVDVPPGMLAPVADAPVVATTAGLRRMTKYTTTMPTPKRTSVLVFMC
jgi:hypothetical protein